MKGAILLHTVTEDHARPRKKLVCVVYVKWLASVMSVLLTPRWNPAGSFVLLLQLLLVVAMRTGT